MNMKAFMKEELKQRGTMEFPGIEKFTDEKENRFRLSSNGYPEKRSRKLEMRIKPLRYSVTGTMAIVRLSEIMDRLRC